MHRGLALLLTALVLTGAGAAALPGAAEAAVTGGAGIQLHPLWHGVSEREVARQLDRAAKANARIVRVDVGWASLEQEGKGRWNRHHLDRLDAVVDGAEARGLKLLLTLADTPCWASGAPRARKAGCRGEWWRRDVQRYLPADPAHYGDALAFLARRYGTRVEAWEMWNEPNHDYFLRGPDKARRYAKFVRAAYARAKPAAGRVALLAGALSESDHTFAEALYAAGIRGSFDGFSIHPYSNDASPLAPGGRGEERWSFLRGVPAVRRVMLRHRDPKPLWLTEFGWSTTPVRGADAWRNGVGERKQAAFIAQALAQVRSWDYVPYAIYYNLEDLAVRSTRRADHFGLVRSNGRPKAALAAFRSAAANLLRARIAKNAGRQPPPRL